MSWIVQSWKTVSPEIKFLPTNLGEKSNRKQGKTKQSAKLSMGNGGISIVWIDKESFIEVV